MKKRSIQLMCQLERVFPPAFFDIQVHLLAHLVEEVEICGTVHARWMYWVERYMKVLKGYVRQAARPEGCMAAGHLHYEAMFIVSEAVQLFHRQAPTAWEEATEGLRMGTELLGKKKKYPLEGVKRAQVHNFVLEHDSRLEGWRAQYNEALVASGEAEFPDFLEWLTARVDALTLARGEDVVSEDVRSIVRGPSTVAWCTKHMRDSGRHFRVERMDINRRTSTDCGVYCMTMEEDGLPYCGNIQDIVEVDFGSFTQVLLGCTWYHKIVSGAGVSVEQDPCGFVRVDTSRTKPRRSSDSDVWVYPHLVDQCFYVPVQVGRADQRSWSLVVPTYPRRQRGVLKFAPDEAPPQDE